MKVLKWAGIAIVGLVVLSLIFAPADDSKDTKTVTETVAATPPAEAAVEPEPEPERLREDPNPDGDYDLNCAYELGDFGESGDPAKGYRFVAGGTLVNTGNIGIRVRVTYKWKLLGRLPITLRKHYKVRRGEERDVNSTVPATGNEIERHQKSDSDCSTSVKIVESFGETPLED